MQEQDKSTLIKVHEKRLEIIKYALDKYDPIGLLKTGCPIDEYMPEVEQIASMLNATERPSFYAVRKIVSNTIYEKYDAIPNKKTCGKIAQSILFGFGLLDLYADLSDVDILKDKVDLINNKLRPTVHDGFIVEYSLSPSKETTTLNGKPYYYDIEEQDVLDMACDFCTEDVVYVQYKHKHFFPFWYALFNRSYFFSYQTKKFDIQKLKHKDDIELIFDRNGVIPIN